MSINVVEAAGLIIDDPSIHGVVSEYPWLVEAIIEKQKWWKDDVKTIAAVDAVKPTNDILRLGWVEYSEADSADKEDLLVELGDVVVFLVAAIVRDVVAGHDPAGVVKMEELFMARYVTQELEKYQNPEIARAKMIEKVFAKIKNNFHPALNLPAPEAAGHLEKNIVYQAAYSASRTMRKHAKAIGVYNANDGLPEDWRTVYFTNGDTPAHLIEVQKLAYEQMINVGVAFMAAYGTDHHEMLVEHINHTAPGMLVELREDLSI